MPTPDAGDAGQFYACQLYRMDTTSKFSSETVKEESEEITVEGSGNVEDKGFFGMLAQSIFEPGANSAVVLAMNVSFFLLLIVLFGLAFLTNWNFHVLMMLVVSALLWGSMIWFVIEMQKIPARPDNMPPDLVDATISENTDATLEGKKDK